MSTHLDRKALKRPDAFLERAGGLMAFVHENLAAIGALIGVLFAAGMGALFYINHLDHVAELADAALYDATKALGDAVPHQKPPGLQPAKPNVSTTPPSPAALDGLDKVARDYPGSRAAFEALLMLGDLSLKSGNLDKALDSYKRASDNAHPRAIRPAALYSLAYAYEGAKRYDDAIVALQQILATENIAFKADALMALGRNEALKGDKPKALDAYTQVIKNFPNTPLAKQAELASSHVR